jgi:Zn-dependent peptidase ImmA (M78 family)
MTTFNNERLKTARLLAGLSLRQLEESLSNKVSYNSINKYEKGLMQPETGTILRLSEVLKVTPAYFFETNSIELGEINFRKQSSLTQSDVELIKEKTKDKIQRYIEAERLLSISKTFHNPIAKKQVKDSARAEEMAELVRSEWGLGTNPIPNVIEMLEENEVKVIEIEASEKFDGLSTYVDDGIPVAVVNDSFTIERKRFTALHELGHLMMNIKIEVEREKENACHRFAGALLFPEAEVRKTLGNNRSNIAMGELVAIKEEYGISAQAAMRRVFDLNIISPLSYKQFCIRIASNKKEEGLGMYKGEERSHRLLQMVFRLFAEGVIDEAKAASLAGISSASFRAMYYNLPEEEISKTPEMPTSAFTKVWGDDEPDYSDEDLLTINPNYEGR